MIPFNFYKFIIVSIIFILLINCSSLFLDSKKEKAFQNWIVEYKNKAQNELDIPKSTLDNLFKNVKYNKRVIYKNDHQIEFIYTTDEYINKFASNEVINQGKIFLKNNIKELTIIEKHYKIPKSLLVALMGVESKYGTITGKYSAVEALSTLAFDTRRKIFFTNELNTLIKLINKKALPADIKSSWAGALGDFQFMPSTFLYYSVTKNNKIDFFASAANYLKSIGWNYNINWGYEVSLPKNFNNSLINTNITKTFYEWSNLGVKILGGSNLPNLASKSKIIVTPDNRAFLVTNNFNTLMIWNRSEAFALTVGLISDQLKSYEKFLIAFKQTTLLNKDIKLLKRNYRINKQQKSEIFKNTGWTVDQLKEAVNNKEYK